MIAKPTTGAAAQPGRPLRLSPWSTAGLLGVGLCLGAATAALALRSGPLLPMALVAFVLLALASLSKPLRATMLIFAALPIGAHEIWAGPFSIPVIQLVVLGAVALIVAARVITWRAPLAWPLTMYWLVPLIGLTIAETPLSIDQDATFRQNIQLVVGALAALAIVTTVRNLDDLRRLVGVALSAGTVMCAIALADADQLRVRFSGAVVENRVHGVFSEPNQLGSFSAMLLFLACGLWLGGRSRLARGAAALTMAVALGALGLSLSRGSWLGAAIGLLGLTGLLPKAGRRVLLAGSVVAVAVAVLVLLQPASPQLGVIGDRFETLSNPTSNPWDARPGIYREAWREIEDHPLTGVGPGGFPTASARPGSETQAVGAYHAHNALLTVAAEAGLPATMALVGFTLALGLVTLRTVRRLRSHGAARDAALVASLGAALLTVVGHGLVDFTLRHPVIVVLVWALVGLVLAAERVSSEPDGPTAPAPRPQPGVLR